MILHPLVRLNKGKQDKQQAYIMQRMPKSKASPQRRIYVKQSVYAVEIKRREHRSIHDNGQHPPFQALVYQCPDEHVPLTVDGYKQLERHYYTYRRKKPSLNIVVIKTYGIVTDVQIRLFGETALDSTNISTHVYLEMGSSE